MASEKDSTSDSTSTKDEFEFADYQNTMTSALDSQGRRSMLLRSSKTGHEMTWAEQVDRTMAGPEDALMRRQFRRLDRLMCWMLFENWRWSWVRTSLQVICLPLCILRLGFDLLIFRWELARSRSRSATQQQQQTAMEETIS